MKAIRSRRAADNLDLGRPDNMEIIFNRQVAPHQRRLPDRDRPGQRRRGRQRLLPALPDQVLSERRRALRIETVVNDAYDLGVLRRLEHFDELVAKAVTPTPGCCRGVRVGQDCVLRAQLGAGRTVHHRRRRQESPALRFGDPRVMALAGALNLSLFAVTGITNKSLRALTARLLGTDYTTSQPSRPRHPICLGRRGRPIA